MKNPTYKKREIARRMETVIKNSGLKQTDVAKKMGIPRGRLSNAVRGISIPLADLIVNFCDVMNISSDELVGLKEPTNILFHREEAQI